MDTELVIRNARVVTPHDVLKGGIRVEGMHIAAVDEDCRGARCGEDWDGDYLVPGLVDQIVHLRPQFRGTVAEDDPARDLEDRDVTDPSFRDPRRHRTALMRQDVGGAASVGELYSPGPAGRGKRAFLEDSANLLAAKSVSG